MTELRSCLSRFWFEPEFRTELQQHYQDTSFLREYSHITGGIPDGVDGIELLCEDRPAIKKRRLDIMDHDMHSGFRLVFEV